MNAPFLSRTVAGLYVTDEAVYRVALTCFRGRIVRVQCATEAVAEGDAGAALVRLGHCPAAVASHLPPLSLRHAVVRAPAFDEAGAQRAWAEAHATSLQPPDALAGDYAQALAPVETGDDHTTCLLAVARRAAVEQRTAWFAEQGVPLVRLGSVDAEVGQALAFHPAFAEGDVAVLVLRRSDASVLSYRNGALQSLAPLDVGHGDPDALAGALAPFLAPPEAGGTGPARLFVAGEGAERVVACLSGCLAVPVLVGEVLLGRVPLPATHLLPAALAMPLAFPALAVCDFMHGGAVERWRQATEKADACRVAAGAGVWVLACLLATLLAARVLEYRLAAADAALAGVAGRAAAAGQAREALAALEREVAATERLAAARTEVAVVLAAVGRALPEGLWLESVRLTPRPEAPVHLSLVGMARDEGVLAEALGRLERLPALQGVRLVAAERARAAVHYREVPVHDRVFLRFEVTTNLAAAAHTDAV